MDEVIELILSQHIGVCREPGGALLLEGGAVLTQVSSGWNLADASGASVSLSTVADLSPWLIRLSRSLERTRKFVRCADRAGGTP